ncbi:MAG TPA: glycine dehydrogenase, partial [bacterium]
MAYIPITPEDEKEMLKVIGVKALDDLFSDVPPSVILKKGLNVAPGLSEPELKRWFNLIGKNNLPVSDRPCFLGAGLYWHEVPAA